MDKFSKPRAPVAFGIPMSESQAMQGIQYISGGVDGLLTKLFNLICLKITNGNGISPIQWNKLMIDHIRKVSSNKIAIDRTSIRGNRNKELRRPGMTWKTFCTKALPFLKMDCFSITIDAVFEDGKETSSTVSAAFGVESKYIHLLPTDKYINPQGKQAKRTRNGGLAKGSVNYSSDAGSILARLFNTICLDYTNGEGLSELTWNLLLHEYIDKQYCGGQSTDRQNAKSSLKKELRRGKMMWKVFCKGLQFLKIRKILITIEYIREDGLSSTVELPVSFHRD